MDSASNDLDRMLTEARKALESMRQGKAAPGTGGAETVEGVGEADDGRVKVTAVSGGRLKKVEINPRAMRLPAEELGEHLVTAANAALDDLRSNAADAAGPAVDIDRLNQQVEEIQNESLRQMTMISQAFNDAISKAGGGRK
ncbi:YbaB/EbfC family nucleoid-associated protein [Actinomadura rifamycini]|uniref:YbaB/EbfC family nucleoid-associated protein n=1 Tax=Actinomadura rifamycini TaxID=31962 RepID=UPI0004151C27|nr:YbaB/EbfC family nucleoid-associated protein [Actinomadura rifamycini]